MASVALAPSAASLSAAQISQLLTDVTLSTSIGGKTYVADVTSSDGEYVASDPALAGAQATGPSLEAAENNEIARIDFFA